MNKEEEIIKVIGDLREDVAGLKEKYEGMSNYIFRDLKPDIDKLCTKIENCMDECYHKNLKWMIGTTISFIVAVFGWLILLLKIV